MSTQEKINRFKIKYIIYDENKNFNIYQEEFEHHLKLTITWLNFIVKRKVFFLQEWFFPGNPKFSSVFFKFYKEINFSDFDLSVSHKID